MKYQWGLKSPFTFATSSQLWGVEEQRGMYPVKIYTIDGVLIYQESIGSNNENKQPLGGIISSSTVATSMIETVQNPIKFYTNPIISQGGHTKDLWDYYWTSYSRGTDGKINTSMWRNEPTWHNHYLADYLPQRLKSIYDPCPFGFRVPSNGTYIDFNIQSGWLIYNYADGALWVLNKNKTWFFTAGRRNASLNFIYLSREGIYTQSTSSSSTSNYTLEIGYSRVIRPYIHYSRVADFSVRCIEALSL